MDIVIFGISKVAEIVHTYITHDESFKVAGFCVDRQYLAEETKFGLPVIAFEDIEKDFPPDKYKMLVAIGYHDMNKTREQKCKEAKDKGYELVSYVNKDADVAPNAKIGKNCIILNNVSVEPFVEIGNNVCLYCNATVAHHSKIDDNVWITSGTVVGGNSTVGKNCFLGINSTIGHNINIGAENFIGAGAVITKNTEDKSVYVNPDTPKYRLNVDQFMKLFKFD